MSLFKKDVEEEIDFEHYFEEPEKQEKPEEPVKPEKQEKHDKHEKNAPKEKESKFAPINKTVISEDVSFIGTFNSRDPIVINGHVEGDITTTSSVSVGYKGDYNGQANVKSMHVDGVVDGKIFCEETASFTESAVMKGALTACGLSTDDGAVFEGTLDLRPKKVTKPVEEEGDQPVTEADIFGE